jgi:hypothetical protein
MSHWIFCCFLGLGTQANNPHSHALQQQENKYPLAGPACKNIFHIQVLVTNFFFPTPPIKLKLGLQIGGRLLIATQLDQSNHLVNQKKLRSLNKCDLTVFIRLF